MNGWVKLHRKMLENIELNKDPTAKLLFIDLLMLSNSKGEIGLSGRELALRLEANYSTLYKALKRLEDYQMVKQFSKQRYTLIMICNWSKYQSSGKHFGKQPVSSGEAAGKQTTGVPRIENKNKEKPTANKLGVGYRKYQTTRSKLGL